MNTALFFIGAGFIFGGTYYYFRHKYVLLTQAICDALDDVISGKNTMEKLDLETQSSKIRTKLNMIMRMTENDKKQADLQRQELQQIVSDISHQLKTPISNVLMYSDTLEASEALGEEERYFLFIMQNQVRKLEFLIQSLVKMSRLENHMLIMKKEMASLFPTISKAVSSILSAADKKGLDIEVHCPEGLRLFFDAKWTEEAIFNVLDNAVKYTPKGGRILIMAEPLQVYTRIQITDTGIGIFPEHQCDIFKRFYKESRVHGEPGVGLGLYLAREILEKQGGYITVSSRPEEGSSFSLFLPNKA